MSDSSDPAKVSDMEQEIERLSREKAEAEAQASAAQARAAAQAASAEEVRLTTEARMKAELEEQKRAAAEKEEREKLNRKLRKSRNRKIIGGIIAVIFIVLVILAGTATVSISAGSASGYPYTTTYDVWFPLGSPVSFNNNQLIALSDGSEMMISVNGQTRKLVTGEPVEIGKQKAVLTTLFGRVPVLTVNYKVVLEYQGNTADGQAFFKMRISTDKAVPDFLVRFLLPSNVIAQPSV
jgi:hypothetical protein